MKKVLNLLGAAILAGHSFPIISAASSYEPQTQILKRSKRQGNFKALNNEIKKWILGELSDNLPETILNRIYKLNKHIKKNSLRIINLRENVARIIWEEDINSTQNFIDVYFTIYNASTSIFYNDNPQLESRIPAPPTARTKMASEDDKKEPIYATVIPKAQRNKQTNVPPPRPRKNLKLLLPNTNLGELSDNLPETIFERVILLNTDINLDQVTLHDITNNLAIISSNQNSLRYSGRVIVQFTVNNTEIKPIKETKKKPDSNSDSDNTDSINKLIKKFNKLSPTAEINNSNPKKVLTKNTRGGRLQAGDTYLGTSNGVYLKHGHGQIDKFDGLNFPIISIELDNHGSAYVLNNTGEIYHLDLYGWGHQQISSRITNDINLDWKVTGPITNDKKNQKTQ